MPSIKTIHAAASVIHLTQTGVTQRIKALEKRLSTSLFVRTRRGMLLTPEGEALLRYCSAFEQLEGEALSYVTGTGIETNTSICMTGPMTIMRSRIIPQCVKVIKKFPHLLVQFNIDDSDQAVKSLRCGDTQLAIVEFNLLSDEMEYKKLKPEEYILVAPQ